MLLMVEKGIGGEICHVIHWYAKANNNILKTAVKTKNNRILNIGM